MGLQDVWTDMINIIADLKEQNIGAAMIPTVQLEGWAYQIQLERSKQSGDGSGNEDGAS